MFHKFKHYFTPHHSNNHKPRALHPQAFIFYILLIFVLQVSLKTVSKTFPNILGFATDISVDNLLKDTNDKRAVSGLSPVSLSPTLSAAAANKANDMFTKNYWAHISPDGKTPWDFITGAGYRYIYAGENLAKNFNDSQGVVDAWMNSPSHRDNLLKKEYREVGFAVVNGKLNGEDTTLVVQMFGSSAGSPLTNQVAKVETIQVEPTISNRLFPTLIPTTIPLIATAVPTQNPTPTLQIFPTLPNKVAVGGTQIRISGSHSYPLFNLAQVSKVASLSLIGFLLFVLSIDSIFMLRRRTVRVSGHNFAHMLFLLTLVGAIYLTGSGVIM